MACICNCSLYFFSNLKYFQIRFTFEFMDFDGINLDSLSITATNGRTGSRRMRELCNDLERGKQCLQNQAVQPPGHQQIFYIYLITFLYIA